MKTRFAMTAALMLAGAGLGAGSAAAARWQSVYRAPTQAGSLDNSDGPAMTAQGTLIAAAVDDHNTASLTFITPRRRVRRVTVARPPGASRRANILHVVPLAAGRTLVLWGGGVLADDPPLPTPQVMTTYTASGRRIDSYKVPQANRRFVDAVDSAATANGTALACLELMTPRRNAADLVTDYAMTVSPTGHFGHSMRVASTSLDAAQVLSQPCRVSTGGNNAAITWVLYANPSATRYQSSRQLYLQRLLPGPRLSAPVPLLPAGADQLEANQGQQRVSVAPNGQIAVAWPYANITKETIHGKDKIAQATQWRMRWLSPASVLGPVIPLEATHGGWLCPVQSATCGAVPTEPNVCPVGPSRALVVFAYPTGLVSELVGADGQPTQRTTVTRGSRRAYYSSAACGGGRAVLAWTDETHPSSIPLYTGSWARGRWNVTRVDRSRGNYYPVAAVATVNDRGQAAVAWTIAPYKPPFFFSWASSLSSGG